MLDLMLGGSDGCELRFYFTGKGWVFGLGGTDGSGGFWVVTIFNWGLSWGSNRNVLKEFTGGLL